MKKAIIAVCLLEVLSSCNKSNNTTTPTPQPAATSTSSLNVTINGHTYHVTGTTAGIAAITLNNYTRPGSGPYANIDNTFGVTVQGQSNDVLFAISGSKFDMTTAIGTYHTGKYIDSSGTMGLGAVEITDFGDGGKQYGTFISNTTYCTDTTSSISVTVSNGNEVKGTFNLHLVYNNAAVPVTGDFDYIH